MIGYAVQLQASGKRRAGNMRMAANKKNAIAVEWLSLGDPHVSVIKPRLIPHMRVSEGS